MSRPPSPAERLHSIAITVLRLVRHVDVDTGLGPAQLSALSVLVFGGPQSPGALADIEQVKRPSMTRIINDLVGAGYVVRSRGTTDGRGIELRATPAGTALLRSARLRRTQLLSAWLRELPAVDRGLIESSLPAFERLVATGRQHSRARTGRRLGARHQ